MYVHTGVLWRLKMTLGFPDVTCPPKAPPAQLVPPVPRLR